MGIHGDYGRMLLKKVAGKRFHFSGSSVMTFYSKIDISTSIDGVINNCCAIEFESRTSKQIRGAIVDLLEHRSLKKLLILIPAHINNPVATTKHCEYLLNKYAQQGVKSKVILLKGTGWNPKEKEDKEIIKNALKELGC